MAVPLKAPVVSIYLDLYYVDVVKGTHVAQVRNVLQKDLVATCRGRSAALMQHRPRQLDATQPLSVRRIRRTKGSG